MSDHVMSVKLAPACEAFLTVDASGLKLSGVQDAVDAEADRAKAVEAAIRSEMGDAVGGLDATIAEVDGKAVASVTETDGRISGTYTDTVKKATQLETARTIGLTDYAGSNVGTSASFDGTSDVTLKLPSTIEADLAGTADYARKATGDDDGDRISTHYAKTLETVGDGNVVTAVSKSGSELTVTKGMTAQERLTAGDNVTITGTTISAKDTTYTTATQTADGLMSASDKLKLDGMQDGADAVSVTQELKEGTKVGTITVNGESTALYAPTDTGMTSVAVDASDGCNVVSSATYDAAARRLTLTKGVAALTSHQTLYTLTVKDPAGATLATYTPNSAAATLTLPTATDTKNTAGSTDSSSKLFLIGATAQSDSPQTYSHDTAYVGTDGCLYSGGKKTVTDVDSALSTSSANPVRNSAVAEAIEALKTAVDGKQDALTIDTAVSTTSENPVQNKVITAYVQGIFSYDSSTGVLSITV